MTGYPMTALSLAIAAFFSTLGGGLFALRYSDRLNWILAFTAGVLLGVTSFDLLPEIFALAGERGLDPHEAMVALVVGFILFHMLEKFVLIHHGHEEHYSAHRHPRVGVLSAAALIGHSFMDGVGIGLAFQVSPSVGIAVSIAVIAHDFCDGLNTVSLMLVHRNTRNLSIAMLAGDAAAPIAGASFTQFFQLAPNLLLLYLGFFAGFLLYIGAADVLPQAHSGARPGESLLLIGLTCAGAILAFVAVQLAGQG
jgi:zinc transporter ZupT